MNDTTAIELYEAIKKSSLQNLVDDLLKAAVKYARYRTDWQLSSLEERKAMDAARTRAHNAFIDNCDILSRNMIKIDEDNNWRALLGDDRKFIGDFACHLHCILGIKAR